MTVCGGSNLNESIAVHQEKERNQRALQKGEIIGETGAPPCGPWPQRGNRAPSRPSSPLGAGAGGGRRNVGGRSEERRTQADRARGVPGQHQRTQRARDAENVSGVSEFR